MDVTVIPPKKVFGFTLYADDTLRNKRAECMIYEYEPHTRMIRCGGRRMNMTLPYTQFMVGDNSAHKVFSTQKPFLNHAKLYPVILPGINYDGSFCTGDMASDIGNTKEEKYISAFWHSEFEFGGWAETFLRRLSTSMFVVACNNNGSDRFLKLEHACKRNPNFLLDARWPASPFEVPYRDGRDALEDPILQEAKRHKDYCKSAKRSRSEICNGSGLVVHRNAVMVKFIDGKTETLPVEEVTIKWLQRRHLEGCDPDVEIKSMMDNFRKEILER